MNTTKVRMLLGICMVLTAGGLIGYLVRSATRGAPTMAGVICEKAFHHFGRLSRDKASRLEHVFLLTNTSDRPARIEKITNTCGCVTIGEVPHVIPPRGQVKLPVRMTVSKLAGEQRVSLLVKTAVPETPLIVLTMGAFVDTLVILSHEALRFGCSETCPF